MAKNTSFHFKQFSVHQQHCAMKVSTDACLFGAQTTTADKRRILDIGSGTGLLSLMAAQRSTAIIEAVELDTQAAAQTSDNFQQSPWSPRLKVHCDSIQNFARTHSGQLFDLIICNPPFFTSHTGSPDSLRNQARHNDSLSFADLIDAVCTLLSDDGSFELLLPTSEYGRFMSVTEARGLVISHVTHIQPTLGKPIHREIIKLIKRKGADAQPPAHTTAHTAAHLESLMVIRNGDGEYSQPFRKLLAPYYLKL